LNSWTLTPALTAAFPAAPDILNSWSDKPLSESEEGEADDDDDDEEDPDKRDFRPFFARCSHASTGSNTIPLEAANGSGPGEKFWTL
jgi:hypothetical protein